MKHLTLDRCRNYNCHIVTLGEPDIDMITIIFHTSTHVRAGVVFHFHPVGLVRIILKQRLYFAEE